MQPAVKNPSLPLKEEHGLILPENEGIKHENIQKNDPDSPRPLLGDVRLCSGRHEKNRKNRSPRDRINRCVDIDIELERSAGSAWYEIDFEGGRTEYEYIIDAYSGEILSGRTD